MAEQLDRFVDPGNLQDVGDNPGPTTRYAPVDAGRRAPRSGSRQDRLLQGPFTPATTTGNQFSDPGNLEPAQDREKVLSEQYVVTDPDKFAETMKKSRLTRLLPSQVEDNPQLDLQLRAGEFRRKLDTAPVTRKWMNSDPANGQMAHDEVGELTAAEKQFKYGFNGVLATGQDLVSSISELFENTPSVETLADVGEASAVQTGAAIREGVDTLVTAPRRGFDALTEEFFGVEAPPLGEGSIRQDETEGPIAIAQRLADATAFSLGLGGTPLGEEGGAASIPPDMSVAQSIVGMREDQIDELITADEFMQQPLKNFAPMVVQTLFQSAPQTAMAAAPGGLPAMTFFQLGTQAYQRAQNEGREEATVGDMVAVAPTAFGSAYLERLGARGILGMDETLRRATAGGVVGAIARGGAQEGVTEGTQTLLEGIGTRAFTNAGYDGAEVMQEAFINGIIGFGAGGTIRAVTAPAEAGIKARLARRRADTIREVNNRAPKLRERDPEAYASWQGEMMRSQGADSVTISDDGIGVLQQAIETELEQTNQGDPLRQALQEQLNIFTRNARRENAATGAGITISPEQFWRLPQSVVDKVAEYTSFRSGDLSAVEAENVEELMRALQDSEAQTDAQRRREAMAEEDAIYQTIRDRLIDSGGALSDPTAADAGARQMAAAFQTLAQRSGIPVEQLRDRFLPKIEKSFEPGGPGLESGVLGQRRPQSLTNFLSRLGGVQDQTGELRAMDADRWHRDRPFRRKLVRDNGVTPDRAREAAEEAGYLNPGSDLSDLYAALDQDLRTGTVFSAQDQSAVDQMRDEEAAARNRDEMERYALDLDIPQAAIDRLNDAQLAEVIAYEADQQGGSSAEADRVEGLIDGEIEDGIDNWPRVVPDGSREVGEVQDEGVAAEGSDRGDRERGREGAAAEPAARPGTRGSNAGAAGQAVGPGEARGAIDLRDMENIVIRLYRAENMSTFLHESGHLYLEMLGALAEQPDASLQLKQDFQTVLDWMEVSSRQQIGREQHEKWAETYEAYLMEGRAPSAALRQAFNKFTAWLGTIYRSLRQRGSLRRADLNDNIRGVLDRILATDEAITEVREQQRLFPAFQDAESAGMTQEEYEEYVAAFQRARDAAHTELVQEAMQEVQRERKQWWREERRQEERIVLDRLDNDPVWRARYVIQEGRLPSGAGVPDALVNVGKLRRDVIEEMGYSLPGGMIKMTRKDGVHPDRAAQDLGFTSGDHLLQALSNMPRNAEGRYINEKEFARQQAEQVLYERHGDIMDVNELEQAAQLRAHSMQQADLIARELETLRKQTGETRRISNAVARRAAERTIREEKTLREVAAPTKYLNAERKYAIQATEAVVRGDLETAYEAKRKQLVNFHMYREARDVRQRVEKMTTRLRKWQRLKSNGKNVHPEFVQQVRELLAPINFRSRMGEKRFQKLNAATLQQWADEKAKEFGASFHIANELEDALTKQHVSEMTFVEFEGLHDTAKSLVNQGQKYSDAEMDQFRSLVDRITESITENRLSETSKIARRNRNFFDRLRSGTREFIADQRTMSSLAQELDGGVRGPVWNEVYNRVKKADDRYIDRSMEASRRLNDIIKQYTARERLAFYRKTYLRTLGESWGLSARLSFALNMGNPGNVEAIQNEYGQDQINEVLGTLTAKDWDVVENIWSYIDEFWPEVKALEERTTGVAPAKVEASPFTVTLPDGTQRRISGGYYPLRGDPMRSKGGKDDFREMNSLDGMLGGGRAQAATQHGHTIERQGFGQEKKVWMDLRVLFDHVDTVIKDIEMREAVHEANRIVQNRKFSNAVADVKGQEFANTIEAWLENTVGGLNVQPANTIEKVVQWLRQGMSMAEMGLSIRTMLQQPFGMTQTVVLIGEVDAYKGVAEFFADRQRAVRKVMDASAFMRNRSATMNRDVRDAQKLVGATGLIEPVTRWSFKGIQMLDMAVSIPSWLGAYQKALRDQERAGQEVDHQAAVDFADDIVTRSQGSGLPRDLSNIQQGSPWKKMFTMFYTFFNAYYNVQTDLVKEFRRRGGVRSPGAMARLALAQVWVTLIPSLLVDYLFNEPPEDEDEYLSWALASAGNYLAAGYVGVRDIANAAISGYSYQVTPVASAPQAAARTVQQFQQGEVDASLINNMLMTTGYVFHIPGTRQATRLVDYGFEEGLDELETFDDWWQLLVTGPREN